MICDFSLKVPITAVALADFFLAITSAHPRWASADVGLDLIKRKDDLKGSASGFHIQWREGAGRVGVNAGSVPPKKATQGMDFQSPAACDYGQRFQNLHSHFLRR